MQYNRSVNVFIVSEDFIMITAVWGIGQLLALVAVVYGALLTLKNRPQFWAEVARALYRIEVFFETFDEAVRLAELARRDPCRAAQLGRERLLQSSTAGTPGAPSQPKRPLPGKISATRVGKAF
jgi:hypothetical protein